MPNEVVHKLARKRDNLGSIECQMLVNQLAIFKALQRGSGDMLALPFPPDSACVDMALAGTAGSREGKMLVNQEVLFHKLCGEAIADMPHAPVGDEAKECIKELPAAPNARSARRRSSLQRGSREARLALNQHAFNSRINGIPVPALPGPAADRPKLFGQRDKRRFEVPNADESNSTFQLHVRYWKAPWIYHQACFWMCRVEVEEFKGRRSSCST